MSNAPSQIYTHRAKDAIPGPAVQFGPAILKWYDLDDATARIAPATRDLAHQALLDFQGLLQNDFAGFVILHQCNPSFAFLLISTWRGDNELWQSVLYTDTPLTAFAPFGPAYDTAPNLRPTFCVWELGIVAHESQAWRRYLISDRSTAERGLWQSNCLHGKV